MLIIIAAAIVASDHIWHPTHHLCIHWLVVRKILILWTRPPRHCFTLLFLWVLRSVWTHDLQPTTAAKVWDWLQP